MACAITVLGMVDDAFVCDDCKGEGLYASGRVCAACHGWGARLCMDCHARPATQVADDYYSCGDCAVLASGCAYCVSGKPTSTYGKKPCCEKCRDAFQERGSSEAA